MASFAELINQYTLRIGIADAELARKIGVRRQTIFRWKEGLVKRPRERDVVLDIAKALRLTPEERDGLLLAAGFAPETMPEAPADEDYPAEVVTTDPESSMPAHVAPEIAALDATEEADAGADSVSVVLPEPESAASPPLDEVAAEPDADPVPVEQKSKPRLFVLGTIVAIALAGLIYIAYARSNSKSVTQSQQNETARTQLDKSATEGAASETPSSNRTTAENDSASSDSTAELTTGSAQPFDCQSKAEHDLLVLVARFVPYGTKRFNVAGRIVEALEEESQREELSALRIERIEEEITNKRQADLFMDDCSIAVLIWGEYDDGRVVAQTTSVKEARVLFPADLATVFDVNVPAEVRILALEAIGLVLLAEERYAESVAAFERALSPQPNAPQNLPTENQRYILNARLGRAHYNDAIENAGRESFEEAIQAYDEAVELAPLLKLRSPWLFYNRGIAYLDLHRASPDDDPEKAYLDLAISDLDAALRIKGTSWEPLPAYTMRGIAHMTRKGEGDMEAAIRDYSAAIVLNPKSDYYFNRGLGHIAANNVESWEVDLDQALELGYPARNVYTAKCYAHLRQYQVEQAVAACKTAVDQEPQAPDAAYVNYAIALAASGEEAQSIPYLEEHIDWLNANPGYYQRLQGKLADEWLTQLKEGEQPFTEEVLRNLE